MNIKRFAKQAKKVENNLGRNGDRFDLKKCRQVLELIKTLL